MKPRVSVMHIMTPKPIVLQTTDALAEADRLFKKHKIRHIPIVDGKKIVGILSNTDMQHIGIINMPGENNFSIPQLMTKTPMTVDVSASIQEVAEILARENFHALPVTELGELVGIVTTTDLINYLLLQFY